MCFKVLCRVNNILYNWESHWDWDWDKFIQHITTLYRCMISDIHDSSYVLFSTNLISNTSLHVGRPLLRPFLVAYAEATLTLVTLGRLTDVSLNKNGGSREAVKNKGSVWVEGERIRSPFLTRRKMTQKPNHSRNEFSLHLVLFEIFEIQNPVNWGLLKTVGRLTEQEPSGDWGLLVKWNLVAIPTSH